MWVQSRGITHETTEALECSGYPDVRVDFNKHAFCGVYVDLEKAGFVQRRVKEREKTLGGYEK